MQNKSAIYKLLLLICLYGIYSCSVNKVPAHKYLLQKNKFKFTDKEKIKKLGDLNSYVKEKPNSKILNTIPLRLWLYDLTNSSLDTIYSIYTTLPDDEQTQSSLDSLYLEYGHSNLIGRKKTIGRFLYRNGEAPRLIDSIGITKSSKNLQKYLTNVHGYFDATVEPSYTYKRKKGKVTYNITLGEQAKIDSFYYTIPNEGMRNLYEKNMRKSYIKEGDDYFLDNFVNEQNRLDLLYNNNGYYNFDIESEQIKFIIDSTTKGKWKLLTKLEIVDSIDKAADRPYKIQDIYIYGDSKFIDKKKSENEELYERLLHKGYKLRFLEPSKYRPRVLTDLIVPMPGDLYDLADIQKTKQKIYESENFTLTDLETEIASTQDSTINVKVWLRPKKKYDLELFFEGAYSEYLGLGITPGVNLLTRNLFQGGENLSITFKGTIGTVAPSAAGSNSNFFNAYELTSQVGLSFPRFILPFNTEDVIPKRWDSKSEIIAGATLQRNIGLGRMGFNAGIKYSINPTPTTSHWLRALNFEFISNLEKGKYFNIFSNDNAIYQKSKTAFSSFINEDYNTLIEQLGLSDDIAIALMLNDEDFAQSLPIGDYTSSSLKDLSEMFFRKTRITQDVLINSFIYDFKLDQNKTTKKRHPWYLNADVELAGTISKLIDDVFGAETITVIPEVKDLSTGDILLPATTARGFFGVPYSQFFKINLDLRKEFKFNSNQSIILRQFFGLAIPFGNSKIISIPLGRAYFAGGANDIRAWRAFGLGPSDSSGAGDFAVDNLKITWNAEYRFKLYGKLNSALFVDAGNIWGTSESSGSLNLATNATIFKLNSFLNQVAVGAGIGFRYDFTYLLLRIDLAYKLRDPSFPEDERWRLQHLNLLKPTLNFGINYPF